MSIRRSILSPLNRVGFRLFCRSCFFRRLLFIYWASLGSNSRRLLLSYVRLGGGKQELSQNYSIAGVQQVLLIANPEKAFPANLVSDGLSSVTSSRGKQLYTQVSYKIQKSIRRERQFFGGRGGVSGEEDWN